MSETDDVNDGLRRRRPMGPGERATEAVVDAVATAEGVDADSLPPLAGRLDPEALNSFFAARTPSLAAGLVFTRTADIPDELEVRFEYAGYDVTVTESYVALE